MKSGEFFSGWNRQKSEFEGSDYLCLILFNSHFHRKFPDDDEVGFLCWNFNWWFSCESLTKNSIIFLYLPHLLFKYWFGLVRFSLSKVQHIVFGVKIISHWAIKKNSRHKMSVLKHWQFICHLLSDAQDHEAIQSGIEEVSRSLTQINVICHSI